MRRSIVGPMILILIGGILLMNNLRPDLSVLDMVARFWPFLLIVWGLLRLIEIFWTYRKRPLPSSGISGGEWTLIVFLCLVGTGLFVARHHLGERPWMRIGVRGMELFGEPYDYPIEEQSAPAGKAAKVILENFRGNVHVTGGDTTDVKVRGRKTVRAMKQSDADEANRMTPLEVVTQGDSILVRTNQEKWRQDQFITADLEVTVPKSFSLEGRGRYGDFDITDLNGNVEVVSDNAGVRVQNIKGNFQADLRRSDIIRAVNVHGNVDLKGRGDNVELDGIEGEVTVNGAYSGDLEFRNLAKPIRYQGPQTDFSLQRCPGQIRMARGYLKAENVVGPITLITRSRDVQVNGFTDSIHINLDRGDIELRPGKLPLSKMDVVTRNGHIELALPEAAKFTLQANVQKGEVQNDFGGPLRVSAEGRGGTIAGSVGDGPRIDLTAERGSVTVRKASGADIVTPLPPLPPTPPSRHKSGIEDIVDRHAEHIERTVDEFTRRLDQRTDELGRKLESRVDDVERRTAPVEKF